MEEEDAINLLKKHSSDEKSLKIVLDHSKAVQKVALRIAKKVMDNGYLVDIDFIKTASLLHDIGRFNCPPGKRSVEHGVEGAEILLKENLPEEALVAARHIGGGISKEDIKEQKLPLAEEDYIPETLEEKIITYADQLIFEDSEGNFVREGTVEERMEDRKKQGLPKSAEKLKKLHEEITSLISG